MQSYGEVMEELAECDFEGPAPEPPERDEPERPDISDASGEWVERRLLPSGLARAVTDPDS